MFCLLHSLGLSIAGGGESLQDQNKAQQCLAQQSAESRRWGSSSKQKLTTLHCSLLLDRILITYACMTLEKFEKGQNQAPQLDFQDAYNHRDSIGKDTEILNCS